MMINSWVRRKSLKKPSKNRFLESDRAISPVMLLSLIGILVLVGIFVVQHSLAASHPSQKPPPTGPANP